MAAKIWKMVWSFGYRGNNGIVKNHYKENRIRCEMHFCKYYTKNANLLNKYVKNLKEYCIYVMIRL